MGCILVRQCHSNTCPVGVCTQRPDLRERFTGTPEKVINLMSFIAEEVREILASLGLRTLEEAVGRTDLLRQVSRGDADLDDLDLNPLLAQIDPGQHGRVTARSPGATRSRTRSTRSMVEDARPMLEDGEKMQLAYNVRNVHRAVGTRLSADITRRYGMDDAGPRPPHRPPARLDRPVARRLRRPGPASSRCSATPTTMSARASRAAPSSSGRCPRRPIVWAENAIIGNTCLYGATAGQLFAAGRAGERFAVRNSGAVTVVEGCGDNGCEYMTGGVAVILGSGRRQLRRRHERRHGLCLGPHGPARRAASTPTW